jgi:hypothetical protein
MVTSTTVAQTHLGQGRTISDVVEHNHALVNEVFCRKIFRQLLASLELQYSMQMPHRAITPDTVVIQENGEPMLLPSSIAAVDQSEAGDLHALAAVVHYAIARELPQGAPLRARGLTGYSDSLLGAIDRCLSPEPRERPRTIDQLRELLGIVSLGAAGQPAPQAPPSFVEVPPRTAGPAQASWRHGGLTKWQRWALIGLAACVLLAALAGLVALLRGGGEDDALALTLPSAHRDARGLDSNEAVLLPGSPASAQAGADPARGTGGAYNPPAALPGASSIQSPTVAQAPQAAPATLPALPAAAPPAPAARDAATAGSQNTEYRLLIKPWGTVYVDGQDRGVSPPVKRLVLPPGTHTVRIVNPAYRDRVLRVEAGKTASGRIAHDFSTSR